MKQLRYRLLIMLAALMLLPTGVGAAEAQKDLKIQDVFTRYGKKSTGSCRRIFSRNRQWQVFPGYQGRSGSSSLYPPMSGSRSAGSTQDQGGDRRRGSGLRLLPASGQRPGRESFCPVQSQLQRDDHTGLYRRRIGQRRPDHPFIYQKRFINR